MGLGSLLGTSSGIFAEQMANVFRGEDAFTQESILGSDAIPGTSFFKTANGYRPSQWGKSLNKSQALLMVPNVGGIFFDGVMSYDEERGVTYTTHPVQDGADISDHGYINAITVNMEVMVSNAMALRQSGGGYTGFADGDKGANAYNSLVKLMNKKQPVKLVGIRATHKNMVVENVTRHEDATTTNAVRISIQLKEILLATVSTEKASTREWTTGGGGSGSVQPEKTEEDRSLWRIGEDEGIL